jgi:hypothetical protein
LAEDLRSLFYLKCFRISVNVLFLKIGFKFLFLKLINVIFRRVSDSILTCQIVTHLTKWAPDVQNYENRIHKYVFVLIFELPGKDMFVIWKLWFFHFINFNYWWFSDNFTSKRNYLESIQLIFLPLLIEIKNFEFIQ